MKPAKRPQPREFKSQHIEIETTQVQNPEWSRDHHGDKTNPRFIDAKRNVRESGITALASKGALHESHVAAADEFRTYFEIMGGAGSGAIDPSKEVVDGGRTVEPITVRQIQAGMKLKAARKALTDAHGEYAYRLVSYIAGEGRNIHELTETRRQRDTMTDNLRTYLGVLAEHWGYRKYAQQDAKDVRRAVDLVRARM